jgi:hypothetical protein
LAGNVGGPERSTWREEEEEEEEEIQTELIRIIQLTSYNNTRLRGNEV